MRKLFTILFVMAATCLFMTGCRLANPQIATAQFAGTSFQGSFNPPGGFIYTDVKGPLSVATPHCDTTDLKVGKSSMGICIQYDILPIATWGNIALQKAMEDGKITDLYWADYSYSSVIGMVHWFSVSAYGK